ncbi:agip101 [Agrotis ipsilon multiple nucleopolyhedrovirus]|uniref:Inhibitor of apoptosis-2 n=1 Tax=Agrotis ipsilon multiple nucleopolyhedrovirus TaxID=208013 RepID=B6D615_9ABAC|nr:agip101 [Agrotis ipsilon multiple nucleopolyhedrovirus]ACI28802.1 inhibitor of apoptosis-2 [Agrotis ipsilon multiple nucleopolyhedrovirus]
MLKRASLHAGKGEPSSDCWPYSKMARVSTKIMATDLAPPAYYRDARARLATYENSCLTRDYIRDLAASGIYRDSLDGYKCAFCSFYLKKLNARHLKYHKFSMCPMATRRLLENEALRKESFRKFKTSRIHYRDEYEQLAKNGFYYYGKKVEIRCSSCHIIIVKLNRHDNAQHIHRRWSPECEFNVPSAPKWEDLDDDDDGSGGDNVNLLYPKLPESDDTIVNFGPSTSTTTMTTTTAAPTTRDDIMCKICFERERDTCFMPCRHVSTCSECAKRCKVCCICREKITNRLEVFLQ